jgi:zinc protease
MLRSWPRCTQPLPEPPLADVRETGGVFLIPRPLEQAVLVLAHPTAVRLGDSDYFAAQIGNTILGAGGFSSRLMARLRTESGYAYSAASLWTTPQKYKGLIGVVTRTRPENAVPTLRLILDILNEVRDAPPTRDEVDTAVDQIANGFVFNFETAAQIIARRMSYLAQDLPDDWLEKYLRGVQEVDPAAVQAVFRRHLHPESMTILVVGDPQRMDMEALSALGPITILEPLNP